MRFAQAFAVVVASTSVWAADDETAAIELLKNMHNSAQTLNYQGTFVYLNNGKMESMQIFHAMVNKSERERVVHLNGSAREVIRENNVIKCIFPDHKSVLVNKLQSAQHILSALPSNFGDYKQFYAFTITGHDRVASRAAKIVHVEPKDKFRYGYRFWLDADNSLLLKSQMLAEDGSPIEQVMFTSLEVVRELSPTQLAPASKGEQFTLVEEKNEQPEENEAPLKWKVARVPDGFKLTGHAKRRMNGGDTAVQHIVLSDGLASMSVYVSNMDAKKKPFVGASNMGPVNVYGSVIDDHQVTVVGEVPAATVKMVAESIEYIK